MNDSGTNTKRSGGLWSDAWKRLRKNHAAMFGLVILAIFAFAAIFADVVAPHHYAQQHLDNVFEFPNRTFWLGTDNTGRCVFSRIIYGSRISLQVGFISVGISLFAGGGLGVIAGFYGGHIDNYIMRFMDVLLAIPTMLLAIVIASTLGPGLGNLMLAVGISAVPGFARIVRASILSIKEMEFVEAARLAGCSDRRIMLRHLMPNILAPIIVQITLGLALAILNASSLSFLGLGMQPPTPEWGAMLSAGRAFIRQFWHLTAFPGIAITIVILAFNMLGDGLRDAMDPRLKT